MSTYREITFTILDELKIASDDSFIQPEHVIFLLDKYRGMLLYQKYENIKKEIPESNYQTICLDLEVVPAYEGDTCAGKGYLRSVQEIPNMMTLSNPKVSTMNYFMGNINYINRERFKYVGSNQYLQNMIYASLAPDEHLYLKSNNPQAYYLKKVKLTGVFEDSAKAEELACDKDSEDTSKCDILDKNYPLEEDLIPQAIQLIVRELAGVIYKPADKTNDANDDLSRLATYLARNLKKGWERDNN